MFCLENREVKLFCVERGSKAWVFAGKVECITPYGLRFSGDGSTLYIASTKTNSVCLYSSWLQPKAEKVVVPRDVAMPGASGSSFMVDATDTLPWGLLDFGLPAPWVVAYKLGRRTPELPRVSEELLHLGTEDPALVAFRHHCDMNNKVLALKDVYNRAGW